MRRILVAAIAVVLVTSTATAGSAYSGLLDTSFSGNGVVNLGRADRAVIAARDDGVVITLTQRRTRLAGTVTTVRATTSDGTPDTTFSGDGIATPRPALGGVTAIAVDDSDRILVLSSVKRTVLTRLTANGQVDRSYADDGRRVIGDGSSFPTALTIDSEGRVLLLLFDRLDGKRFRSDTLVARVLPGGRLDDNFGRSGLRRIDLVRNDYDSAIDTDARDRPVIAGGQLPERMRVYRLTHGSGRLDPTFSENGVARIGFGTDERGYATQVDATNGVTVGGFLWIESEYPAVAAKFTEDGSLDSDFGGDGWALLDVGSGQGMTAVAIDESGAVLTAGFDRTSRTTYAPLVGGFLPDGSIDTGFGPRGRAVLPVGRGKAEGGLAVVVDGQFVLLVRSEVEDAKSTKTSYQLVRLLTPPA